MDRRTIIFGIAVLALIIIVWYFMFRKRGEPDTGDLPIITIGNVSQSIRSADQGGDTEGYRIEYYTDAELSAYIDFTVEWTNGFGFQNVTHLKVIHKVDGKELRSKLFNSGAQIKNFTGVHQVKFEGDDLATDTSVPSSMDTKRNVKGTNTFEIQISTDGGSNYSKPRTVPSEVNFPSITINEKELNIPLELAKGRSVNYTFEPVLDSDDINIVTAFLNEKYFIHPRTEKKSIQSSLKIGDQVQRYTPIVISKSDTVPPAVAGGTAPPPPVNLYLRREDQMTKTITLNILYVDSDGRLQVAIQGSTVPTDGNKDFYIIVSTLTDDGNTYYHIKEYGKTNNFLVLNKISNSDDYNFMSEDITRISSEDKYRTIEFDFAKSSDGLDVDCVQESKTIISCQTLASPTEQCGEGEERKTLSRGEKCVRITHTTKRSGSGTACPNPEGEFIQTCPVNCVYKDSDTARDNKKCNPTCKRSTDPSSISFQYVLDLLALNGGSCPTAPSDRTQSCPSNVCPACLWEKDPTNPGQCSTDLVNHPRSRRFNRRMIDTGACEPSTDPGDLYEPDNSCPDKAPCERRIEKTGVCIANPLPFGKNYVERTKSVLVKNEHARPSSEPTCVTNDINLFDMSPKCTRGNCKAGSLNAPATAKNQCIEDDITEEQCLTGNISRGAWSGLKSQYCRFEPFSFY